ncbi:acetyltransferase-like isoleucine patch superfamily enzyme [Rhizobium sp. PP-WC-2G-219]|nr:acetyltransferase-like isoleucine patch superfamily enzyme [Rhizobium sp. PP-WC-2G-219]
MEISGENQIVLFRPDGRLKGFPGYDVVYWAINDRSLWLRDESGSVLVKFLPLSSSEGRIDLKVKSSDNSDIECTLHLEIPDVGISITNPHVTTLHLKDQILHHGWEIGRHTYGWPLVYSTGHQKLVIGNFTAIGQSVTMAMAYHRPDFASIFPFVVYQNFWPAVRSGHTDHISKGGISIGSDVWIGHGAFIGDGVTVGHGAVIGAQSVVTKNVDPYSIVAGNPAKVIRTRFSPEIVERLLKLCWWDWPDNKVNSLVPLILSSNVEFFLEVAEAHDLSEIKP